MQKLMGCLLPLALAVVLSVAVHGGHRDNSDWAETYSAFNTVHVPFLLAPIAQDPGGGILRIINHSDKNGFARITGIDDEGRRHGEGDWYMTPKGALIINAAELEEGRRGYTKTHYKGLGNGVGHWRLEIRSQMDLEVLSYTPGEVGIASSTHSVAPETMPLEYRVPIFNGGTWRSQLRISNLGMDDAAVATITAIDDEGEPAPGGEVEITIPPEATCTVSSAQLESGDGIACDATGWLGNGAGKWHLLISAGSPIQILNLFLSPTGQIVNLSDSPRHGRPYSLPGRPRKCTDERELAQGYAPVPREWDGTPVIIDVADNFPDYVSREEQQAYLLDPMARTADLIERQIGYRVIEAGEIIAVPTHIDPDGPNLIQEISELRRPGHALIAYWGGYEGLAAWVHRSLVIYGTDVAARWKNPDYASTPRNNEAVIHEVFHALGFKHPPPSEGHDNPNGVHMFRGPLDTPWAVGSRKYYPSWIDIDALRCIYPSQ